MALFRQHAKRRAHLVFDVREPGLWRAVFAEWLGTLLLVQVGCMAVLPSEVNDNLDDLVAPALCFAAVIVTLIHVIGPTSGCNINPAVTLALVVIRRCHPLKGILYFVAQILGGIVGSYFLYLLSPYEWCENAHLCMTRVKPVINCAQAVGVEVVTTGVLVLIVMVISDPDPHKDFEGFPSLAGGLAVLTCVYAAAPYTGASLNPARSFGPALVWTLVTQDVGELDNHWVYWIGPLGGALLATLIYRVALIQGIHKNDPEEEDDQVMMELEKPKMVVEAEMNGKGEAVKATEDDA